MFNQTSKTLPMFPRLTVKPFKMFFRLDRKLRQRQCLRNLDARTLQDIGMSEARRQEELQNWSKW
jgi:uncharacterized protein YjiS (DUF1127 family)